MNQKAFHFIYKNFTMYNSLYLYIHSILFIYILIINSVWIKENKSNSAAMVYTAKTLAKFGVWVELIFIIVIMFSWHSESDYIFVWNEMVFISVYIFVYFLLSFLLFYSCKQRFVVLNNWKVFIYFRTVIWKTRYQK